MKALTKKHPGYSLLNSVMPRNLFPIFTRYTQPNLALCQVFLKALISGVFHFFKDHIYNFYVQEIPLLLFTLLMWSPTPVLLPSSPETRQSFEGTHTPPLEVHSAHLASPESPAEKRRYLGTPEPSTHPHCSLLTPTPPLTPPQ